MSNTYQVLSANYDSSAPFAIYVGGNDPLVYVALVRNGARLGYAPVYWSAIQSIFAVAGSSGLQSYFAAIADGYANGGPFNLPTFAQYTGPIPAPVTGSSGRSSLNPDHGTSCAQALVGTWVQ